MKKFIIVIIVILALAVFTVIHSYQAGAHQYNWNQCNENNPENCPVPSVICGNGEHVGNPHCIPDITDEPTGEVTPTEEITPTVEVTPTATPEATPTTSPSNNGDGKGDGRSDGLSSCPSCTQAPNIPSAPPATGRGR